MQTAVATQALARQQALAAASAEALALAEAEVVGAASEAGAAQITLTRSTAAVAAAERELANALRAKNIALIDAASQSVRLAQAQQAEALTALQAARAQVTHARTLDSVSTAGLASGASLLGLRGAVLTAGGAFLGATVGIQAFIKAVQSAADLERQLNVFRVTAGATADEMERVAETARLLGQDVSLPAVSAGDAAQALTELSKAGLSVQDSIASARGVLQLATAAQIDNERATLLVANALNSFSLRGEEAVRVADLLTGASLEAQGSIEDMGIALRQAAGAASQIGIPLEDTVTLLTLLARSGLAGSDAGTTLRVALLRLVAPTAAAREQLEKFNIQLRDARTGAVRTEALFELEDALKRVSAAEADAARVAIFGQNAFRVSALLGRTSAAGFQEMAAAVSEQGLAAEVAAAQTQGLSGQLEALRNQADTLGITIGQLASGPLKLAIGAFTEVATGANTAATAFQDVVGAARDVGRSVAGMVPFLDQAEGGLSQIARTAVRLQFLGPVMTAATFAIERFGDSAEEAAGKTSTFDRAIDSVSSSLDRLQSALETAGRGAGPAEGLSPEQILKRVVGFEAEQVRAEIRGSTEDLLAVLESEQAFLEQQLARGVVTRRPELRRQLESALLSVINEIEAVQQGQVRATEDLAREAERARAERDRNILAALGREESRRQNAVIAAEATDAIKDDLQANIALRNFYRRSIEEIRRTVQDAQTRASATSAATADLIRAQAEVDQSREELKQALRDEQREERERQRERLDLAVQIAQATGNRAAEIRARENEIDQIKEDIRQTRRGSLQRKRLILELRQAQRDLRELQKETQKTGEEGQSFRELTFSFLQQQQGFASNLLGNLIPGFATAGLVGGGAPPGVGLAAPGITPGAAVQQEAAVAAGRDLGFSRGQGNETNQILRQILVALQNLNGRAAAPEARYQRAQQSAFMDVIGT